MPFAIKPTFLACVSAANDVPIERCCGRNSFYIHELRCSVGMGRMQSFLPIWQKRGNASSVSADGGLRRDEPISPIWDASHRV